MKLSILIPTIVTRRAFFDRIMSILSPQVTADTDAEIVIHEDDGEEPIGTKRNKLVANAQGDYLCFVDDDDVVPDYYVAELLKALESNPDCVGWRSKKFTDGIFAGHGIYSLQFERYDNIREGSHTRYQRVPCHLNPIRAELVRQVPFANSNFGEDTDYARRIRPLLKTEVFIDKVMYIYEYRSKRKRKGEKTNAPRYITE